MPRMIGVIFVLACCMGVVRAAAGNDRQPPALAILVHAEPGGEALADPLRALLEVETSRTWEGGLLERAELATVLQEMTLTAFAGDANVAGLQPGKMERAANLVLARVRADEVRITITGFPKTDILCEKVYTDRLEPESLATRASADVLKALRAQVRDPKIPYTSVGAFYCVDPHRRFMEFSRSIETALRAQLGTTPGVRLMERLFPSDLLNEFTLARGGLTVSQAIDFNAPPADLLLYGECTPQKNQDLNAEGILLDCTVTVTSPTRLLSAPKSVALTCRSNDIVPLVGAAKMLLAEAAATARNTLEKGGARGFSTVEFDLFKRQAFRLMPAPPNADGTFYMQNAYRGPGQWGTQEELERALRMLECASLFTGTDTTVLDCTAAVLGGLQQRAKSEQVKASLQAARLNLVERAYRLESTPNTREFYSNTGLLDPRKEVVLPTARRIWNTRDTEAWYASTVDAAFQKLATLEPDAAKRRQYFLDAAPAYAARPNGLYTLMWVISTVLREIPGVKEEALAEHAEFAQRLIAAKPLYLQAFGHLLSLALVERRNDLHPDPQHAVEFARHYRACLALVPQLYADYRQEYTGSNYAEMLGDFLINHTKILTANGMKDELADLQEQYIIANCGTDISRLSVLPLQMRAVLPSLRARHEEARAIKLLDEFLKNYTCEGAGDYDRMEFTRELNCFKQAQDVHPRLALDQLTAIPFDDGKTGAVVKLVPSPQGIVGLRVQRDFHAGGQAFQLLKGEGKSTVLTRVAGTVYDVACTAQSIGIGTEKDGFYLLDAATLEPKQFTPKNSTLPGAAVWLVASMADAYLLGVPDKDNLYTLCYRLDPVAGQLSALDEKFVAHAYWRITSGDAKMPVVPQHWGQRTTLSDGKRLTLSVPRTIGSSKDVTVTRDNGEMLFQYRGYDLTYVFDFCVWQGYLVFATGNGLYVTKPGTNTLRCILSAPDLVFYAFQPAGDHANIGTGKGLFRLEGDLFNTVAGAQ